MAAYQGYNAAEEVFLLHIWARRGTHGQKLRAILAISHEEHSMLCDVACRTNERVVLETTDHRIVRDHVGQDQLSATRPTMHRSHVYRTPPVVRVIDISPIAVQVRLWICLRRTAHVPLTPDPCRVLPKSSLPQQPSSSRGGRQTWPRASSPMNIGAWSASSQWCRGSRVAARATKVDGNHQDGLDYRSQHQRCFPQPLLPARFARCAAIITETVTALLGWHLHQQRRQRRKMAACGSRAHRAPRSP